MHKPRSKTNVNGASRLSNFWNFFVWRDPNDFLSRLVTTDESWLYHYDPETKQQLMEWRHSGSPRSVHKNSEGKIRWKNSRHASIFWDQDGILLIDYLSKGQTINMEYYSSLLVQVKDILNEKRRAAGRSPRGSCSCTMPRFTGHLQPRRNWPTCASSILSPHPILWICLRRTTTCSLHWKKQPFFVRHRGYCCRGDLVGWTTFWVF
jgi:hypothetical protein